MPWGERIAFTTNGPVSVPSGEILVTLPATFGSREPLLTQALPSASIAIVNGLYRPPPEITRAWLGSPCG